MNRMIALSASLAICAAAAGCDGSASDAQPRRTDRSSSAGLSPAPVKVTTGYASKLPSSCSFLDDRPDLLAAFSVTGIQPTLRTAPSLMMYCRWQRQSPYNDLLADVTMYLKSSRQDNIARMQRSYRADPCPRPVTGLPHPRGLTWEEGCLETWPRDGGAMLTVRRGNAQISVSYDGRLVVDKDWQPISDKSKEQALLQVAQALLESLAWDE